MANARFITGFHGIEEYLRRRGKKDGVLFASRTGKRYDAAITLAESAGVPVQTIGEEEMQTMFPHLDHRGIVLVLERESGENTVDPVRFLRDLRSETVLVLILDEITDPHNYGAILRSADQFAVDLVVTTSRRSAHESATVARTSAGASAYVPIAVVPNLVRTMELLKKAEFWIYGAEAGGASVAGTDLSGRVAIVLGSEGGGLRRLVREHCDGFVSIPQRGHIDSLNVSVAAGIIMYETRRGQGLL